MKAKTELLLYRMTWLAEGAINPTFRNITESFEGWAYRNGLLYQIDRLEAQGLLEAKEDPRSGKRLHRLTEAGRRAATGGRDPEAAWAKKWNRKWRMILFDIPERESSKRKNLTRSLAKAGCGCLQGSVWISPSAPPEIEDFVTEDDPDCSHLLLLLADSKGDQMDKRMVLSAWDFEGINDRYRKVVAVLNSFSAVAKRRDRDQFERWTVQENSAWKEALAFDPLLPGELLPKGYLGRKVCCQRNKVMAKAARLVSAFSGGE